MDLRTELSYFPIRLLRFVSRKASRPINPAREIPADTIEKFTKVFRLEINAAAVGIRTGGLLVYDSGGN